MNVRTIVVMGALGLVPGWATAQDKGPLELRFLAKRTAYPLQQPGKDQRDFAVPAVALIAELKNVGKTPLEIITQGPELEIKGPKPGSVKAVDGGPIFFVAEYGLHTLAAGETVRIPVRQLQYHHGRGVKQFQWLEAGEYEIGVRFPLVVIPAPPGSKPPKNDHLGLHRIDPAKAGEIVLSAKPLRVTVKAGDVLEYWTAALKDKDADVRRIALDTLADMKKSAKPAVAAVLPLLEAADAEARLKAILALEAIAPVGDRAVLPALKTLKDGEIAVRAAGVKALARLLPKEKETPDLLLPLVEDRYALVRRAALEGLHSVGFERRFAEPKVTETLLRILDNDPDTMVRYHAIHALQHVPEARVVRALIPFLKNTDTLHKQSAAYALGRIAGSLTEKERRKKDEHGEPVHDAIVAMLDHLKEKDLSAGAAFTIGRFGPDAAVAVPALVATLNLPDVDKTDWVGHPRVWIVQAFRQIGPGAKGAIPELLRRLDSDLDFSVRLYSAQALAAIGVADKETVPALRKALGDKMIQVRTEAAYALGKLDAVDALIDGLQEKNADTRQQVIYALGEFCKKHDKTVKVLTQILADDPNPTCRSLAAAYLGHLGATAASAVERLTKSLADADKEVRLRSAEALGAIGPKASAAIPDLLALAKNDKLPEPRQAAAKALFHIGMKGRKQDVPALIELLADRKSTAPHFALLALGNIGPDAAAAIPAVQRLADGPDETLRAAAKDTLRRIKP